VANLNTTGKTFTVGVGLQRIVYNGVPSVPAGLGNGAFVEVRGTFQASDNTLLATVLEVEDSAPEAVGDSVKVEGYVNRILAASGGFESFELIGANGLQTVTWSTVTTTPRDGSLSDIGTGVKVQVEGTRRPDKSLRADEISFRKPNNVKFESTVGEKGAASFKIMGLTVAVNSLTQFEDDSAADVRTFGFADLNVSDAVRVSALLDNTTSPSTLVATRVERIDSILPSEHILQGPVSGVTAGGPDIVILGGAGSAGIRVITSEGTTSFHDRDDSELSQAAFFSLMTTDGRTIVKARGTPGTGILDATGANGEAEIEPTSLK